MSASCCHQHDDPQRGNPAYKRVLWIVLAINAVMFLVEIGAGVAASSASLQADALDFLGDAGSYSISLAVVGMALRYRAMAAFAKGLTMAAFGLGVIGTVIWQAMAGTVPEPITMGVIGVVALIANAACATLLYVYRDGRRQHAICVDLLAQRRHRQSRSATRGFRCVWDRHWMARPDRGVHQLRPPTSRCRQILVLARTPATATHCSPAASRSKHLARPRWPSRRTSLPRRKSEAVA
jgi:hypothetical protein